MLLFCNCYLCISSGHSDEIDFVKIVFHIPLAATRERGEVLDYGLVKHFCYYGSAYQWSRATELLYEEFGKYGKITVPLNKGPYSVSAQIMRDNNKHCTRPKIDYSLSVFGLQAEHQVCSGSYCSDRQGCVYYNYMS